MKRKNIAIIIFIFLSTVSTNAIAQKDTQTEEYQSLFEVKNIRGYIGFHAGGLNTADKDVILNSGATVAVILNHRLALGVTGNGYAGFQNTIINKEKHSMVGGFGGLMIEPILMSKKAIHLSFPISVGAGESQYFRDSLGYRGWEYSYNDEVVQDYLYITPAINLEFNLAKWMRFGITGAYMMTETISTSPIQKTQLDGLSFSANLKFGWFK